MVEAALALTTALTLMSGAKPDALRQARINAARERRVIATEGAPPVCRMPVIPSESAPRLDRHFTLRPDASTRPAPMPSAGKLLPCPVAGNR
jgi:hypothetical protein